MESGVRTPTPLPASTALALLLLLFLPLLSPLAYASIHVYRNEAFLEVGSSFLLSGGSEGIFASSNSSSSFIRFAKCLGTLLSLFFIIFPLALLRFWSSHQNQMYRFENIKFSRSEEAALDEERGPGLVQVVIFEAADRNNIGGSAYGGQRSICCTPDLSKLEGCKQGEIIRIPSPTDPKWPFVLNVNFEGDSTFAELPNEEIRITRTGMYNLFFIACEPKLKSLSMSGKTSWKNPHGYLPGRMAPLLKFYVFLSIAYALLSVLWFSQYVRFRGDILQLQHCISVVIGLGLLEMILWYFDYANFNNTGTRPIALTTWVITIGALRKTVSRILILCVSMGYGVVRPSLGGLTSKVLLLSVTYFLASELLNISESVGTINDVSGRARILLVLPDAFLDSFLILWIFNALSRTLEQLQGKRSSVKLDIYRKFSNALAVTVLASVAWIGYEVYFKATDPFNERWQSAWIITAFWDILALALLCVICYLWAPSQSSQRYAYSDRTGEDSDDEEAQALTRSQHDGAIGLVKLDQGNNGEDITIPVDSDDDDDDDMEAEKRQ